jgi:hypothetical protein
MRSQTRILRISWICLFLLTGAIVLRVIAQTAREPGKSELHKEALAESLVPIRPGVPGKSVFWNVNAKEFIYAPAFDMKPVPGASHYRFTASASDGTHTFEAEAPWAPLSPIWADLPAGKVVLQVQGIDKKGGTVVGESGSRTFYRAAVFDGPYHKPVVPYAESARLALRSLLLQSAAQAWLREGKPDPGYRLNCYPAKVMGAMVLGMTKYSTIAKDKNEAVNALVVARRTADFLLGLSEPAGQPLEFFPPTYWDGVNPGPHPVFIDRTMMHYPADAALAYLDLYDRTHNQKYFEAAQRIAQTYRKTQLPSGVWPLVVKVKTGEAIGPNLMIPTLPIMLMNRLASQYQVNDFKPVVDRAFQWIMDNPVRKFNWDAQFEDARPVEPYVNLSREQACDVAVRLLQRDAANPKSVALAEELLRFSEDQFVVWEPPKPEWKEIVYTGCNPNGDTSPWFTPAVMEQYRCYGPVARSIAIMIDGWRAAYVVTRKPLYLAKARSLANTLTIAQQYWKDGTYPTWVRRTEGEKWLNNVVHTARLMLDFAAVEERSR